MKLLKLVYMAHGWCLAILDRPLIMDRIEAWDYGPVIPAVYHAFRWEGTHNLSEFPMEEREFEPDISKLLENVCDICKSKSAIQLPNLSHVEGGPRDKAYGLGHRFKGIGDDMIKEHYKARLRKARNV
ncbi:MAG: DUF4065 domain-containing protein [Roseovarius sp.]|nr:DUF4065 domain-containing protein [Roseovarius sp.]